ncbi:MAG: acetyl-CoA carboxylase biotin carboxyl carrier protein [Acidobacteria bacterium]|nr:acetyl-CoA carboxylase biotin carboxyl carrier protein [Acidobacteriota bacterium]
MSQDPSFNMDELQALAALVNEHGFTDFEFENENIRVRLSKTNLQAAPLAAVAAAPAAVPATAPAAPAEQAAVPAADPDAGLEKILSPIVGTFYRAPGPDKDPYVSEGSRVDPNTTVCIVEAMKLMNEIQAETSGEIVKIYVENGQPVEFGQPLFAVKK